MQLTQRGTGLLDQPKRPIVLGGAGLVLTLLIGLIAVTFAEATQASFQVDVWIHDALSPWFDPIAKTVAQMDHPPVVAAILLVLGVLVAIWRGWLAGLGAMWVAGAGWLSIYVVKVLVSEPRPTGTFDPAYLEHGLSFPSGHATFAVTLSVAAVAASAGWSGRWIAAWIGVAFVLLTALTRLYLGVHYPIDVIGGMIGGFSAALLMIGIWNAVIKRIVTQ